MTFGEVVSSYNMFGNDCAKRRNYMVHHQETHVPDTRCTIHDKVAILPGNGKDPSKSWSSSSRGLLTPRWSAGPRSRTPSPCRFGRPRSQPGTPRASTPNGLRPSDSRDRYFKDPVDFAAENYLGDNFGVGATYDSKFDGRYSGSAALDTFAIDHVAADSFAIGAEGKRGHSYASNYPSLAPPMTSGGGGRARPSASLADSGPGAPALRTPVAPGKGIGASAYDRAASRSSPGGSVGQLGYPSESIGKAAPQLDARAASFVRLNSFLFRTHVTSLVSALAEDGWLEAWEKERLCSQAREDSPAWAQAFFRSYMRFMDTEDVPSFVASLRSQIV